ncbi:MAG TPA: riboflavin biosynthesis protein RibF [Elusimicrobiota bacterium]|nr:riboflavin biosynthesis protein RibF [Elusimicrobiota bacterium]
MSAPRRGTVLTIGTFDGVHVGHRVILRKAVSLARKAGLSSLALTFARPPRLYFSPQKGPLLITLPEEKAELLRSIGVDRVEFLAFGKKLAALSPEDFFKEHLLRRYGARQVVVGFNFGFGRRRAGHLGLLKQLGASHGVPVHIVPQVSLGGRRVSSGKIRRDLWRGELAAANRKLGYPYFLSGQVVRGDRLGRRLGFPTANVRVPDEKLVPPGVFAVRVVLPNGTEKPGMCNVGFRPTLGRRAPRLSIEAHVLDFRGNLRGKKIKVVFVKKIRSEKAFPTLEKLAARLRIDAAVARRILRRSA